MMLPHGYEGQGPEHSSARLERFLDLVANDNMRIANVTTSAQHFHLLRRQVMSPNQLPLVIMSPKFLLRGKNSRSSINDFTSGSFQPVVDDVSVERPDSVERIVLASGKVAYDALAYRDDTEAAAAVVRVEQLYPWPAQQLQEVVDRYPNAREVVWLQEEPQNMGAWRFVLTRLPEMLGEKLPLRSVARMASGSPASGTMAMHNLEHIDLMSRTFNGE